MDGILSTLGGLVSVRTAETLPYECHHCGKQFAMQHYSCPECGSYRVERSKWLGK